VEWEVELHDAVVSWFEVLYVADPESARLVELGRPLVDRIHGSRFHKMKELRPASAKASEVRILFAFDPERRAILLVAGDKSGNWQQWYRTNIPIADARYAEHLAAQTDEER
jgi:hypothetical protein